jgi:hypothetical protein
MKNNLEAKRDRPERLMSEVAHFEIRVWALEETSNLGYLKLKMKNLLVVVRKSVQALEVGSSMPESRTERTR